MKEVRFRQHMAIRVVNIVVFSVGSCLAVYYKVSIDNVQFDHASEIHASLEEHV